MIFICLILQSNIKICPECSVFDPSFLEAKPYDDDSDIRGKQECRDCCENEGFLNGKRILSSKCDQACSPHSSSEYLLYYGSKQDNSCKECLDKWFNIGKSSCPMCRTPIDYFKHLNKDTRVICVTKTINRPPLPNNNGNLIIQRRLYLILLTGSIWSLISSGLNIYLSISYSK